MCRSILKAVQVHLVATGKSNQPFEVGEWLAVHLEQQGLRVLCDDRRGISAGVKFADAELMGAQLIVTVGRGLANETVEVRDRWTGEWQVIALEGIAEEIARLSVAQRWGQGPRTLGRSCAARCWTMPGSSANWCRSSKPSQPGPSTWPRDGRKPDHRGAVYVSDRVR
jgi:hypothetical protein